MSGMSKARERILELADEGSFAEFGAEVTRRSTDFGLTTPEEPGDGVITGYATVGGMPVAIYGQDREVLNGTLGEMHAGKILRLYEFALKTGLPVIGMLDSAGIRLEEATDALEAFGKLYGMKAKASGRVLQIDLLFGTTGGAMAVASGLSDFVLMERSAELFVNAPNTLQGNYTEKENTASADFQAKECGTVDYTGTKEELFAYVKELLRLLPSSCQDFAVNDPAEDLNRMTPELEGESDVRKVASSLGDGQRFLEVKREFQPSVVTGFIELDGMTTAVIANAEDTLTAGGLRKAAAFVRFADAYGLAVLTLSNAVRLDATVSSEKEILRAAASFAAELSSATVPKINVVLKKAIGNAYLLMNSGALGADTVFALRGAEIGVMEASSAGKILGGSEETVRKFEEKQTALQAAKRGYVDELVEAASLRKKILLSMEILSGKRDRTIERKHAGK